MTSQPIKVVEVLRVGSSGHRFYVNIPSDVCDVYDIRKGDKVKVEIKEHFFDADSRED